ncbi:hypothetical protein [Streptomyces marispadix]|uniref:DUF3558 domain-containing protein n=1 Tax=Streptomyces marispadix TaxID=2922868 RepID=A0ABS9T039_9ACTN|nr:hypothetical protein [Streptomyces marispadix]MCH6161896.1 hypothetical protein [Streptomyces marispadix]
MQRRARTYATGVTGVALVAVLSGCLSACTGSSDDGGGPDTKPGNSSSAGPPAEPGKYRTLPEPCGAVGIGTLKKLLPGAEAAESAGGSSDPSGKGDEADPDASPYKGQAIATYDTDRRVGCRWKSATTLATRHLSVDLERVVSYDPAVSDDEQAQLLYDERAGQAEIPTDDDSSTPPDDGGDAGDGGDGGDDGSNDRDADGDGKSGDKSGKSGDSVKGGSGSDGGDDGSEKSDSGSAAADESGTGPEASQSPDEDLSPRILDDIGDNAYIDDQLDTSDSGVHRDITLVFRSANVIATVKYDQWLTDKRRTPDSAELQENARSVAEELAADFEDD